MKFDKDEMAPSELALQMLSSIRTLDGRINELSYYLRIGCFKEEIVQHIREKVKSLIDTRFKLVYSMMDTKSLIDKDIGARLAFDYEDLKRKI